MQQPLYALLAIAAVASSACSSGAQQLEDVVDLEHRLLQTLDVESNGTIAIKNPKQAKTLIGEDWEVALEQLHRLNGRILAGEINGFASVEEIQDYRPNYNRPAAAAGNGTAALRAANLNPDCIDDECLSGLCCCRGWWIFCWGYCSCN